MARKPGRILPFRIPFFRIFYSTTYTTLYTIEILLLAITPATLIFTAIEAKAYQYIFVIGGVYVLTALLAIFIYSSRLYTNRTILAGVGKPYLPIEKGEVGKGVRRMIVAALERSGIVAWESRPRDLKGEILRGEEMGFLPVEGDGARERYDDLTVGRVIVVDPQSPPWGRVKHPGWSSPSASDEHGMPDLHFATVIAELPNLVEAKAVSLAPIDPTLTPQEIETSPSVDPVALELLQRPANTSMRDYLAQLSTLGLINPTSTGQTFLRLYEAARFSGRPLSESQFKALMAAFADLLAGMTAIDPAILDEIQAQADARSRSNATSERSAIRHSLSASRSDASSEAESPITARKRYFTPQVGFEESRTPERESWSSVIRSRPGAEEDEASSLWAPSFESLPSGTGSVIRQPRESEEDERYEES